MISKSNLFASAFLLASVLGLASAHAEGVAKSQPDAGAAAQSSARARVKAAGKRAGKLPARGKAADAAVTPAPVPAPSSEKMDELRKHPEARSGRGHL